MYCRVTIPRHHGWSRNHMRCVQYTRIFQHLRRFERATSNQMFIDNVNMSLKMIKTIFKMENKEKCDV